MADSLGTRKRKQRRKRHPILAALLFIAFFVGLFLFAKSSVFSVKAIAVYGNSHYTKDEIITSSGIKIGSNLIFDLDKKEANSLLLRSPYIKSVKIERSLPSGIVITVEERTELAAVAFGEDYVILDGDGIILALSQDSHQLPIIYGFKIVGGSEGIKIETENKLWFSNCLSLLSKAKELDLYFELVDCSQENIKAYIYFDRYYCVGNYENMMDSLSKIKTLIAVQYKEKVSKGIIYVGSEGYISFAP